MATLIDSLVVALNLDPKGFKQGEREAGQAQRRMREDAVRTQKEIEEVGKRVTSALNTARNAAIGLFAVFIGGRGISNFVRETSEGSAALGRLSRDLGITTERLSAWEGVSRRVGNSANEITGAFQNIQDRIQQARLLNNQGAVAGFRAAGIALADGPNGERPRTTEAIYEDVLRHIARQPRAERLTRAQSMGFGQETVNLALAPNRAQMLREERPNEISRQQVDNATRLREALIQLDRAVTSTARQILDALSPAITALLTKVREFVQYLGGDQFVPYLNQARDGIKRFADYLMSDDFFNDLKALKDNISQLVQKIVDALRWLGLIPEANAPTREEQELQRRYPLPTLPMVRVNPGGTPWGPGGGIPRWWRENAPRFLGGQGQGVDRRQRTDAEFAAEFGPAADRVAQRLGVSREAVLAHWSLETNNGRSFAGTNNLGNLTATAAQDATRGADTDGAGNPIIQRFRNFENLDAFADAYASWVERRAPDARGAADARAYGEALRRGNYATDPRFAQSLSGVARRFQAPPRPDPALTEATRPGAAVQNKSWGGSTITSETAINGPITVHTQAADANGIARDLGAALKRHAFVDQVTLGLA